MTFTYETEAEAIEAYDAWVNAADSRVSDTDRRKVVGVVRDGLTVTLTVIHPFENQWWEPLQIKRLFTVQEWANAKSAAPDTFENMTLIFEPIHSDTVATHLRALVGSVLTAERFTEITGRAV